MIRKLLVAGLIAAASLAHGAPVEAKIGEPCNLFVERYAGNWHIEGNCSNLDNWYVMRVGGRFYTHADHTYFNVYTGWTNTNYTTRHIARATNTYGLVRGWLTVCTPSQSSCWSRVIWT